MKQIFSILLILCAFSVLAQTPNQKKYIPWLETDWTTVKNYIVLNSDTIYFDLEDLADGQILQRKEISPGVHVWTNVSGIGMYAGEGITLTELDTALIISSDTDTLQYYRLLNNHDSLMYLQERNYSSLTGLPTLPNNSVQSLSGTTVTMNVNSGLRATLTLTGSTTLTITNLIDGGEGLIEVTNGGTAYTLNINGSTGYTTEKVMGTKATINTTVSTHTTAVYWRTGSTLYYGFIYDN